LKLRRSNKDELKEEEERRLMFLLPVIESWIRSSTFMTVNPHMAYFWLKSSNAHLFAEAMAKSQFKQMLDYIKPFHEDWKKYMLMGFLIMIFTISLIAIWLFIGQGHVSTPSLPKVIPTPQPPKEINI